MSEIIVTKLTSVDLLRKANSFTTGRDSKMSLRKAYAYGHTPIRTQLFFIEMEDIPLFCASQFVRSKVGVEWWQRSKRTDRGGEDFTTICEVGIEKINQANEMIDYCCSDDPPYTHIGEAMDYAEDCFKTFPQRFDRFSPTSLAGLFNAEAIINMSHKRLCMKVSKETREIWKEVLDKLKEVDPDLAMFCVRPCIYKGYCSEPQPCRYATTDAFKLSRNNYLKLFEQ